MIFSDARLPLPESFNDVTTNVGICCLSLCSLSDAIRSSYSRTQLLELQVAAARWPEPGRPGSMARSSSQEIAAVAGNRGAAASVINGGGMMQRGDDSGSYACAVFFCGCRHWHNQGAARVG
jgi:hypothetical protein